MDGEPVSFLGRPPGGSFDRRIVVVEAGDTLAYHAEDWRDALVVVEHGEIALECTEGGRRRFAAGAVLFLTGLPLVALHNEGTGAAVVVAVRRRGA